MEPARRIIEDSNQPYCVTDAQGRQIEYRKGNALDTLRLFKAAGPELSKNEAWLSMASLAFTISKIDGVPVPQPVNEGQIENIILRLGDAGVAAVASGLEAVQDATETSVGNSLGTQF